MKTPRLDSSPRAPRRAFAGAWATVRRLRTTRPALTLLPVALLPVALLAVALLVVIPLATVSCSAPSDPPAPAGGNGDATAIELVEQGRALWSSRRPDDLLAARDLFRRAIDLDPELAGAWSGLADASALLGLYSVRPAQEVMPEALQAADRALALDPDKAATHASRGLALYLHEWDFVEAEQAFLRAIELDEAQVNGHHWFGMMLSVLGRHDEALHHMRTAAALAPRSALLATKIGTLQLTAGRLAEAQETLIGARERHAASPLPSRELGYVALAEERPGAAVEHFLAALLVSTEDPGGGALTVDDLLNAGDPKLLIALAQSMQRSGRQIHDDPSNVGIVAGTATSGIAVGVDQVLDAMRRRSDGSPLSPVTRARLAMAANAPEEALDWLARAVESRDPGAVYLRTKPSFEELEADERFLELCRRIGI